jgi:hypothetical protein
MTSLIAMPRDKIENCSISEVQARPSSQSSTSISNYIYKKIPEAETLKKVAGDVAIAAGVSLAYGIPAYLLYNYNTSVLHPSFQSAYLSFDFSLRGADILLLTAGVGLVALMNAINFKPNF